MITVEKLPNICISLFTEFLKNTEIKKKRKKKVQERKRGQGNNSISYVHYYT